MTLPVHVLDLLYLGIPGAIAAYVIEAPAGPILVETGPASTIEHLYAGLNGLGLRPADIRHVLVTHIHLDHAGAAGHLARHGAHIYVHEFGARHLINPEKLVQSATRIYGDQMDRLWGSIIPLPAEQVTGVRDGDVLQVAGLEVRVIQTPGHARHHHALAIGDECFVGDAAGITVPGIDSGRFLAMPTPPPEFDPHAWRLSIERLQAEAFRFIYPTHFGRVENPDAHLRQARHAVAEHEAFMRADAAQNAARTAILTDYLEWIRRDALAAGLKQADFGRYLSTNLLTMNVDGMIRWWRKSLEDSNGPDAGVAATPGTRAE
jgi:glyoxylase-like metal-dependent hydrolase (beta-lactamase superfamily II)